MGAFDDILAAPAAAVSAGPFDDILQAPPAGSAQAGPFDDILAAPPAESPLPAGMEGRLRKAWDVANQTLKSPAFRVASDVAQEKEAAPMIASMKPVPVEQILPPAPAPAPYRPPVMRAATPEEIKFQESERGRDEAGFLRTVQNLVQVNPDAAARFFDNAGNMIRRGTPTAADDIERGLRQLQGIGIGAMRGAADFAGVKTPALDEQAGRVQMLLQQNPALVASLDEIGISGNKLADALAYAQRVIAEQAPMSAPSFVTGGAGGIIARNMAARTIGKLAATQPAPPTPMERLADAGRLVPRELATGTLDVARGVPVMASAIEQRLPNWMNWRFTAGPDGFKLMQGSLPLEQSSLYQGATALKQSVEEALPADPRLVDSTLNKVLSGITSAATMMVPSAGMARGAASWAARRALAKAAGGAVSREAAGVLATNAAEAAAKMGSTGGVLATAMPQGAAQGYDEAQQKAAELEADALKADKAGQTEQAATLRVEAERARGNSLKTGLLYGLTNVTEIVPVSTWGLRIAAVNPALAKRFVSTAGNILFEGAEEAIQNPTQQGLQNYVAQKLFDKDRELAQGLKEANMIGGVVGTLVAALTHAPGVIRSRMAAKTAATGEQPADASGTFPSGARVMTGADGQPVGIESANPPPAPKGMLPVWDENDNVIGYKAAPTATAAAAVPSEELRVKSEELTTAQAAPAGKKSVASDFGVDDLLDTATPQPSAISPQPSALPPAPAEVAVENPTPNPAAAKPTGSDTALSAGPVELPAPQPGSTTATSTETTTPTNPGLADAMKQLDAGSRAMNEKNKGATVTEIGEDGEPRVVTAPSTPQPSAFSLQPSPKPLGPAVDIGAVLKTGAGKPLSKAQGERLKAKGEVPAAREIDTRALAESPTKETPEQKAKRQANLKEVLEEMRRTATPPEQQAAPLASDTPARRAAYLDEHDQRLLRGERHEDALDVARRLTRGGRKFKTPTEWGNSGTIYQKKRFARRQEEAVNALDGLPAWAQKMFSTKGDILLENGAEAMRAAGLFKDERGTELATGGPNEFLAAFRDAVLRYEAELAAWRKNAGTKYAGMSPAAVAEAKYWEGQEAKHLAELATSGKVEEGQDDANPDVRQDDPRSDAGSPPAQSEGAARDGGDGDGSAGVRQLGGPPGSPNAALQGRGDGATGREVAAPTAAPAASPKPAATPKLARGEKGTGEIFKGADQPFNLAGEQATDWQKVEAAKTKAAAEAAEAKAIADRAQGDMFAPKPEMAESSQYSARKSSSGKLWEVRTPDGKTVSYPTSFFPTKKAAIEQAHKDDTGQKPDRSPGYQKKLDERAAAFAAAAKGATTEKLVATLKQIGDPPAWPSDGIDLMRKQAIESELANRQQAASKPAEAGTPNAAPKPTAELPAGYVLKKVEQGYFVYRAGKDGKTAAGKPLGFKPTKDAATALAVEHAAKAEKRAAAKKVQEIADKKFGKGEVTAVDRENIPPDVKKQAAEQGANPRAFYLGSDGRIYIVVENIPATNREGQPWTMEAALENSFQHELFHGLKDVIGEERFNKFLRRVREQLPQEHLDYLAKRYKLNPNTPAGIEEIGARVAEDVDMSSQGVLRDIWRRIVAAVREEWHRVFGNRFGKMTLTDNDVRQMLMTARRGIAEVRERKAAEGGLIEGEAPVLLQPAEKSKLQELIDRFKSELDAEKLNAEQRGIYDVVIGKRTETEIKKSDLDTLNKYVLLESGSSREGAVHIIRNHYSGAKGPVTAEEIVDIGSAIRGGKVNESISDDRQRVYEHQNAAGVRFRVVVGDAAHGDEKVISFFSNRTGQLRGHSASAQAGPSELRPKDTTGGSDVNPAKFQLAEPNKGPLARTATLQAYTRNEIEPAVGEPAEVIAVWDMMDTLRVPKGWKVEQVIPSGYGSGYWEIRDSDGDKMKVSVRDHSPSLLRAQQFGGLDDYVVVGDARNPNQFAEGMDRLESLLQNRANQLGEIKAAEQKAFTDVQRKHDGYMAARNSVEGLKKRLEEAEDLLRRGLRLGNWKPITTNNQRAIAEAGVERLRGLLVEAEKKASQGEKSVSGDSQESVLGSDSTKTGEQTNTPANGGTQEKSSEPDTNVRPNISLQDAEPSTPGPHFRAVKRGGQWIVKDHAGATVATHDNAKSAQNDAWQKNIEAQANAEPATETEPEPELPPTAPEVKQDIHDAAAATTGTSAGGDAAAALAAQSMSAAATLRAEAGAVGKLRSDWTELATFWRRSLTDKLKAAGGRIASELEPAIQKFFDVKDDLAGMYGAPVDKPVRKMTRKERKQAFKEFSDYMMLSQVQPGDLTPPVQRALAERGLTGMTARQVYLVASRPGQLLMDNARTVLDDIGTETERREILLQDPRTGEWVRFKKRENYWMHSLDDRIAEVLREPDKVFFFSKKKTAEWRARFDALVAELEEHIAYRWSTRAHAALDEILNDPAAETALEGPKGPERNKLVVELAARFNESGLTSSERLADAYLSSVEGRRQMKRLEAALAEQPSDSRTAADIETLRAGILDTIAEGLTKRLKASDMAGLRDDIGEALLARPMREELAHADAARTQTALTEVAKGLGYKLGEKSQAKLSDLLADGRNLAALAVPTGDVEIYRQTIASVAAILDAAEGGGVMGDRMRKAVGKERLQAALAAGDIALASRLSAGAAQQPALQRSVKIINQALDGVDAEGNRIERGGEPVPTGIEGLRNSLVPMKPDKAKALAVDAIRQWTQKPLIMERTDDQNANIERGRVGGIPPHWINYRYEEALPRYVQSWARRAAEIEAFGQGATAQTPDLFDEIGHKADTETQDYLRKLKKDVYGLETAGPLLNTLRMAQAYTAVSKLGTGNVFSVIKNFMQVFIQGPATFGPGSIGRELLEIHRLGEQFETARNLGILRNDLIGGYIESRQLGDTGDKIVRIGMNTSGWTVAEETSRVICMGTAIHGKRAMLADIAADPNSLVAIRAKRLFEEHKVDWRKLAAEGDAMGPETRKWLRAAVRELMFNYDLRQVGLVFNSPPARLMFQFQKYLLQMSRFIDKRVLTPAFKGYEVKPGETPTSKVGAGVFVKNGRLHDLRPLLVFMAAIAGSEVLMLLRGLGYGKDRPDPTWEELARTWDEKKARAAWLATVRLWRDLLFNGALGMLGSWADMGSNVFDRMRARNPLEPPSFGTLRNIADTLLRGWQEKQITPDQWGDFLVREFPGINYGRSAVKTALVAADAPLDMAKVEAARRAITQIRKASDRYKDEAEFDRPHRMTTERSYNVRTADYDLLYEMATIGDADGMKAVVKRMTDGKTYDETRRLIAGAKAMLARRAPGTTGGLEPDDNREYKQDFGTWLAKRQPDLMQTLRKVEDTYGNALYNAGLAENPKDIQARERSKAVREGRKFVDIKDTAILAAASRAGGITPEQASAAADKLKVERLLGVNKMPAKVEKVLEQARAGVYDSFGYRLWTINNKKEALAFELSLSRDKSLTPAEKNDQRKAVGRDKIISYIQSHGEKPVTINDIVKAAREVR